MSVVAPICGIRTNARATLWLSLTEQAMNHNRRTLRHGYGWSSATPALMVPRLNMIMA
ncbi:MAG: hypothetical protein ABF593_01235 [Acetobacter papayae]